MCHNSKGKKLFPMFGSRGAFSALGMGPLHVSYRPAPLLWQLGLDTERIIVPFSSKGVNRMTYLAHAVTVVWFELLFVKSKVK